MSIRSMKPKTVLPFVLAAFVWAVLFSVQPLSGTVAETPRSQDQETTSVTAAETDQPGAIERLDTSAAKAKPKRFPWLLVGAAVVVLAAAVVAYMLIKKDKEGLHEDFDKSASSNWILAPYSYWSVAGGYWVCDTHTGEANGTGAVYNQAWSTSAYTVNMISIMNKTNHWTQILLTQGTDLNVVRGYSFGVSVGGLIMVAKINGMSFITLLAGGFEYLKAPTLFAGVNSGSGAVNELEVIRRGTAYDFYVNGQLALSFTDATYDPRYTGVSLLNYGEESQLRIDHYYVDVEDTAAASRPRAPVALIVPEPGPVAAKVLGK